MATALLLVPLLRYKRVISADEVIALKRLLRLSFLAFCFLFLVSSGAAALAASKVVVTFASFSEREGILFVAQDANLFRKYDLDAEVVYVPTGSVALSALSRGSSQFNTGSASGATLGAIAGGSDVAFIAGLVNKLT